MAIANPYQQYKKNVVNTSTPQELALMLYNGLIKHLKLAAMSIDENNREKTNNDLVRAQNILEEFMASLDMNYELSAGLYSLYDYMYWRLVDANIHKDKPIIEEVINLAEELRDTWHQAMKLAKGQQVVNQ